MEMEEIKAALDLTEFKMVEINQLVVECIDK